MFVTLRKNGEEALTVLYDKNNRRVCALCQYARDFRGDEMLCMRKGPVSFDYHCRHFCYDPMRRRPSLPAPPRALPSPEAFQL